MKEQEYDAIVIGSGPAGQSAATTAATLGARTLIIEKTPGVGGSCVHYGTIPSKTLRETAVTLSSFSERSGDVYSVSSEEELTIASLMLRRSRVASAYQATSQKQMQMAGVDTLHGKAKFESTDTISVVTPTGSTHRFRSQKIFIATGSRPRNPDHIPIDHEHILDSDSLLSMTYLPRSLAILGGGVIACEYASIFSCLGVRVVIVDKYPKPLGFLDPELSQEFLDRFLERGGKFLGEREVAAIHWDGSSQVEVVCSSGETITTDKAFVALGRVANTQSLNLQTAGIELNSGGLIPVDENFRTEVETIYAVGDAIGRPALASSSIHQGRSAAQNAFSTSPSPWRSEIPMGIYTIPEISCVGKTEDEVIKTGMTPSVGRVSIDSTARGQIMASTGGFLKLVADPHNGKILGVQIVGEGATELIHIGQLAISGSMTVDDLSTTNFNFPTLAELYRLASLDIINSRPQPREAHPELSMVEV